MVAGSLQVSVGQEVDLSTPIGRMGATRKCNRKALAPGMLYYSKLAMCNIFKSMYYFRNSEC